MKILLEADANVNTLAERPLNTLAKRSFGRTPLQLAAEQGDIDIVGLLLKAGANASAPPSEYRGLTALQGAAIGGYFQIARILLNRGAGVNASSAESDGRMALKGAAEHGRLDMVQLLLDAGVEIEGAGRAQYDRTLNLAAENGHYAVCKLLRSFHDSRFGNPDLTGNFSSLRGVRAKHELWRRCLYFLTDFCKRYGLPPLTKRDW